MISENRILLFKDLCARLPYGVKVTFANYSGRENCTLNVQYLNSTYSIEYLGLKPYLRPMSSMTEEEKKIVCSMNIISDMELNDRLNYQKMYVQNYTIETFDYLMLITLTIVD